MKTRKKLPSYLLLSLICILSNNNAFAVQKQLVITKNIVGFLQSARETYPHERGYSDDVKVVLKSIGANVESLDYNEIIKKAQVQCNTDKSNCPLYKCTKELVRSMLHTQHITHVLIPGNYYNLNTTPYPPNNNRQFITAILTELADEHEIYLMGICGGLQGIVFSKGIGLTRVDNIIREKRVAQNHTMSMPYPGKDKVLLHRIRIDPSSRLFDILKGTAPLDKNGWMYIYLPEAHNNMINLDHTNIIRLHSLGYKIVAFTDDGVIEAIEDKNGNIHFQGHPEALAKYHNKKYTDTRRNISVKATVKILQDFLARHTT